MNDWWHSYSYHQSGQCRRQYGHKILVSDRFRFYGDSDALSKCLIGIKYYHYDTEIRSVTFSYLDKKGYFFLQSLSDSEQGKHTFDYYMPDVLPNPLTFSTDHWGFWKGGDITQMNDSQLGSYCYNIEANRAVDTAYFNTALLQKVVYPTGGYSEIKYEPNVYNVYHRRDSLNFNHLSFKTGTKGIHAGGARVRSITNKDLSSICRSVPELLNIGNREVRWEAAYFCWNPNIKFMIRVHGKRKVLPYLMGKMVLFPSP